MYSNSTIACQPKKLANKNVILINTVNAERLAELNFRVFHGFKSTTKVFFCEYKHLTLFTLNNEHFWPRKHESISMKTSIEVKSRTFSLANFSTFTVVLLTNIKNCYAKQKHLGCKKVRPIRSSNYLSIHVTKSFEIS